jgi:putative sigma-54 modulation protein
LSAEERTKWPLEISVRRRSIHRDDYPRPKELYVRIDVRGRNTEVTPELEDAVRSRFRRVAKQVSELATLDVELSEEKNPRIADKYIAEATLRLKGVTVRAKEASPEMLGSIHQLAEDVRRQVKKNRELRRHRAESRRFARLRKREA